MVPKKAKLSIVCPAYEEEECLPFFHQRLTEVLARLTNDFDIEIIYVEDDSSDRTLEIIKEFARNDERVQYLSMSRNFGHQASLTAGLEHAQGDLVITMDSDLQHPPAVIPQLLAKWREGYEVVVTIREEDGRLSFGKRLTSKLFYLLMGLISDTDIRPAGSDFRLMTRKSVNAFLQLREKHRFLRGMVQWMGFPKAEVSFHPDARKAGRSKFTWRRLVNLANDGLYSFSLVPLRLAFYLGLVAFSIGILGTTIQFGNWLWSSSEINGWMVVLFSSHLLGGCILWSVGILGEYVGRIYEQVKARPLYVIKENSRATVGALAPTAPRAKSLDPTEEAA